MPENSDGRCARSAPVAPAGNRLRPLRTPRTLRTLRNLCLSLPLALVLLACGYSDPYASSNQPQATVAPTSPTPSASATPSNPLPFSMGANKKPVTFPNGLKYVDVKVGSGTRASTGMSANVDYSLYLTSGKLIQSSINSGSGPLTLTIGSSGTIPGFSQGVAGMRIGGIRRLVIPPNLGFGNSPPQSSGIPDNATLVFLVRLNSVSAATPSPSPS